MDSGHLSGVHSDLKTHPGTDLIAGDPFNSDKKLRSSSSSRSSVSDSSSEDPFELDASTINESKNESINGLAVPSPVPDSPATQSPPMQVMERPGDFTNTPYRIPSSVFARTNTTSPVDWSVCSNESLFSIHVGNTSFNKDPLFWTKSGELGKPGDPYYMPSPLIDYSSNQPPVNKSTELGTINTKSVVHVDATEALVNNSAELDAKPVVHVGATEASSARVMKEVIMENKENQTKEKFPVAEKGHCSSSLSRKLDANGASTKSFAFPILTGDSDKNGTLKTDQQKILQSSLSQPQTPQTPQMPHDAPLVQSHASKKETRESEPENQSQTPKGKPEPGRQSNWFSCFSCCPLCSS